MLWLGRRRRHVETSSGCVNAQIACPYERDLDPHHNARRFPADASFGSERQHRRHTDCAASFPGLSAYNSISNMYVRVHTYAFELITCRKDFARLQLFQNQCASEL